MRFIPSGKLRALIIIGALALLLWAAYYFLWPTYSRQNYIHPDEVRLAAIPDARDTYEVHRDTSPRLLRRLIGALNGAPQRFPQIKLDLGGGVIVVHRSRGPSVLIRYGRARKDGPILFRDETRGSYGSPTLYRSGGLDGALQAIRSSKKCLVKRPRVPAPSLSRIVLHARGRHRTVPGPSPEARSVLSTLNDFLSSVDTSFYALLDNATRRSFYRGELNPQTHLSGTTGALLILDPPLPMHTNMMFWGRDSGPPAEYQEFKTHVVLISDALSISDSFSREPRKVVGFSSDARPNRFYLFDAEIPSGPEEAGEIAEKWKKIIRVIEEAAGTASPTP